MKLPPGEKESIEYTLPLWDYVHAFLSLSVILKSRPLREDEGRRKAEYIPPGPPEISRARITTFVPLARLAPATKRLVTRPTQARTKTPRATVAFEETLLPFFFYPLFERLSRAPAAFLSININYIKKQTDGFFFHSLMTDTASLPRQVKEVLIR